MWPGQSYPLGATYDCVRTNFMPFFEAADRIRPSFAHDPLFAVSMSGVRGLPYQIVPHTRTCCRSRGGASCWLTVLAQVRRSWPADPEGAEDTRVVDRCLVFLRRR